jgi:hypothetical protein
MVKLVAQFRRPDDPEQLLADVVGRVVPHCRTIPGVERVALASAEDALAEVEAVAGQKGDRRGPPFLIAELYFPDRTAFDDALATPEAESALGELLDVCNREVHIFLADVQP